MVAKTRKKQNLSHTHTHTHTHTDVFIDYIRTYETKRDKLGHAFPKVQETWESEYLHSMILGIHPSVEILSRAIFCSDLILMLYMRTFSG